MAKPARPNLGGALDALWLIGDLDIPTTIRPTRFKNEPLEHLDFPDQWGMDTDEYIRRMTVVERIKIVTSEDGEPYHRRIALGATPKVEWYEPQFIVGLTYEAGHVRACDMYATPSVAIENATPAEPAELIRVGRILPDLLAAEAHGEPIRELASYEKILAIRDLALATGSIMLSSTVNPL